MGFLSNLFGGGAAKAAKKAAHEQSAAAKRVEILAGNQTTAGMQDLDRALRDALGALGKGESGALESLRSALSPYTESGATALESLMSGLGLRGADASKNFLSQFQTGPGYQFAMQQGGQALDRSASARGGLYSGAAAKELTQFGQGLANQEFGSYLDRISGVADRGYNAASTLGTGSANILSNFAGQRSNALLGTAQNKGNIRMTGLQTIADAITQGGQARAGGILGAANARAGGASNILSLLGGGAKFLLSGGLGGLGGPPVIAGSGLF